MFSDSEESEFSAPEEITFEQSKKAVHALPELVIKPSKSITKRAKKSNVTGLDEALERKQEHVAERKAKSISSLPDTKLSMTTLTAAERASIAKLRALAVPRTDVPRRNCAQQYKVAKIIKAKK